MLLTEANIKQILLVFANILNYFYCIFVTELKKDNIMETTKRFDEAAEKLYKAFNNDDLIYGDCSKCAVGNIVGGHQWAFVISCGNAPEDNLNDIIIQESLCLDKKRFNEGLEVIKKTGYTPEDLFQVEIIFSDFDLLQNNKQEQFKGLMAVLEYLASLDNIELPKIIIDKFEAVLA